jgi:3-polyprenyl-4-hydroxybenzoate decarboxylase
MKTSGSKLGIDAMKKIPGEGFKRACPPCGDEALGERRLTLIKMDEVVKAKIDLLFNPSGKT